MVTRDGKKYLCALPQEETKETSQKKEEKPAAQLAEEIVQTILQKNAACIYTVRFASSVVITNLHFVKQFF